MTPDVPPGPADLTERLAGRRLWLTGARGFIGGRVAALAAEHGATVLAFEGDVRDAIDVTSADPDLMLHLAAPVNVARDPSLAPLMQDVIVGGARNVRAAAEQQAQRRPVQLVVVGTCEEYGTIAAPFHEDDAPSAPVSPYAAAKLQATTETLDAAAHASARLVVARPFLTYGPGQRSRQLVPAAIARALAGEPFPMTAGLQTRELNYVDDIARGLLRAVLTAEAHGHVVNIGCGVEHRVVDIVRLVFRLAGADPDLIQAGALPTRSGEVAHFYADVTRARALLGHQPTVALEDGLRRTIDAARETT